MNETTADQLRIWPISRPEARKRMTIDERFLAFHAANPHVLHNLIVLAREMKARGHQQYSIKGLWEVLRHRHALQTDRPGDEDYKLDNNYTAHYARLVMREAPDLWGFFETRRRSVRTGV